MRGLRPKAARRFSTGNRSPDAGLRRLRQCRFVERGSGGLAFARAVEFICVREAQRLERALDGSPHRLDRDHRRAKRSGIEVFRDWGAALRHEALYQARERPHQRQEHGDADDVIGGMIGGEQAVESSVCAALTISGVTNGKSAIAISAATSLKAI